MNLIAAVDKNWAIGNKGQLLVSIPQDQKQFRDRTLGKVIVMGRKTLESLPGGQPLYGRTNIVLTANPAYKAKGAIVCHSMEEVLRELEGYDEKDVYVIGGESVYRMFLPYCDMAYVTYIDFAYEADTHVPPLDQDPQWKLTEESDEQTCFDLCYTYQVYERIGQKQEAKRILTGNEEDENV